MVDFRCYRPFLQRSFFTRRNTNFLIIVLLFAVIGGIGIAHLPRRRPLENEENPALQQGKVVHFHCIE